MKLVKIALCIPVGVWWLLTGCAPVFDVPAPSSALEGGTYAGVLDCETSLANSSNEIERFSVGVEVVINDRGVPVIDGREFSVGRPIALYGGDVTLTHIEAVEDGIMWWFEPTSDSLFRKQEIPRSQVSPDAGTSGNSQLLQVETGVLRYDVIQILRDDVGGLNVQECGGSLIK